MKKYFYSLLTILCFSFLLFQIVKTYSLFESNIDNEVGVSIASGDQIFFYEQNKEKKRVVINLAKVVSKRKITNVETTFEIDGGYEYSSEYVIGSAKNTVVYHKLGSVLKILSSRWIFLFVIILPILFIFLYELYEFILEVKRNLKEV